MFAIINDPLIAHVQFLAWAFNLPSIDETDAVASAFRIDGDRELIPFWRVIDHEWRFSFLLSFVRVVKSAAPRILIANEFADCLVDDWTALEILRNTASRYNITILHTHTRRIVKRLRLAQYVVCCRRTDSIR